MRTATEGGIESALLSRGLVDDHLLETRDDALLEAVTGLAVESSGHVLLGHAGIRSMQRLELGDVAGGVAVLTWPAELQPQARYLYRAGRAQRLLDAARAGGWEVDVRPHLAFWLARPEERVYLNSELTAERYVEQWSGPDRPFIRSYDPDLVRPELWPWLLAHGYASSRDEELLDPYLARLRKRKRKAHLRPGLRLLRRWSRDDIVGLGNRGALADSIRAEVNRLLLAVDDPPFP